MSKHRPFISKAGTMTTDTGVTGVIDAANDVAVIDIEDLDEVSILANQLVDAGTVVLQLDVSFDGTNFVPTYAANLTEASFAAGNGVQKLWATLSDARGMVIHAKKVRVTATALAAGGSYSIAASGVQRQGYAG